MYRVQATSRVGRSASGIARRESVECCIGKVHSSRIRSSAVDRIIKDRIVLVEQIASLNSVNFYKRRYYLSICVRNCAGRTR